MSKLVVVPQVKARGTEALTNEQKIGQLPGWPGSGKRTSSVSVRYALYALTWLVDALMIAVGVVCGLYLRFGQVPLQDWAGVLGIVEVFFLFFAITFGSYSIPALRSSKVAIGRTLLSVLTSYLLLSLVLYLLKTGEDYSRVAMATSFAFACLFTAFGRMATGKFALRTTGGRFTNEIFLVEEIDDLTLLPSLDTASPLVFDLSSTQLIPSLDDLSSQIKFAKLVEDADRIVVACKRSNERSWTEFLRSSDVQGEILATDNGVEQPVAIGNFQGRNTLVVSKGGLTLRQKFVKRLFDVAVASLILLFSFPLMLGIALAIKLDSRGPVFFRQERLGKGNVPFKIFKFRSMKQVAADLEGTISTARGDPRITRVGRILRTTSLDELPQLLNVLAGHMSIVGPRPHALGSTAEDKLFWQVDRSYWKRHVLKPGITGLAQVRGHRGATETAHHLKARLQSDLEYIANWSLANDVGIILRTLEVVVHPNAY